MRVCDEDYELIFWDVESGTMIAASATNDVEYDRWSTTLGWPVQGVYEAEWDGTDVNMLDVHPGGEVIARADDFGKVGLLKYPCLMKGSGNVDGLGHSSHVTNVKWMGENRLMSCGGHDLCLFQWNVELH